MIVDNVMSYSIQLPSDLEGGRLNEHLNNFDKGILEMVAGFSQVFLEHFLIVSKGQSQKEFKENLKKMNLISQMIGPTGNLHYLSKNQVEFILTKIDSLKNNEISEQKISSIADEQLEKEFGSSGDPSHALEEQLASAAFYLINMGYPQNEIEKRFAEVRQDPSKLDALFTMPLKEIYNVPSELQQNNSTQTISQDQSPGSSQNRQEAINRHIQSISHEIPQERAQKVDEIMEQIIDYVRDNMTKQYEDVFRQIHPSRLNRVLKMLKQTKKKSKRIILILEWFFCSHLLSSIELKVEHWQVSSQATHGQAGVYTAGLDFSRYDPIVKEFNDSKLAKVINISRRILQIPSKKAIQKLGQDLTAETGFDEHLYFTD